MRMSALAIRALGSKRKKIVVMAAVAAYSTLCLFAMAVGLRAQSTLLLVAAIVLPIAPFAFVAALRAPLIFPFCLYMAFIPFENLSLSGPLGSAARILAATSACALLGQLLIKKQLLRPGRSVAIWGLWMLLLAASTMWAIDPSVSLDFLVRYAQLYMLFAVIAIVPVKWSHFLAVLAASIVGAICAAIYGDYLFLHTINVSRDNRIFMQAGDQQIDPNHFAAALLVPFAIALIVFLRLRFGLTKLAMLAIVCTIGSGFIISGSRGGLMATCAMLLYFALRSRYRIQLFVLGSIAAIVVTSTMSARFALALSTGGAGRTFVWRTAYAAFRKAWLVGTGIGSFQDAYDRSWFDVNHGTYVEWHIVAHNLVAQTSVELGIVGLGLVVFAWWTQFRSLAGTKAASPYDDLRLAIEGATLALFVSSFFLDIMWYKYTWEAFMLAALARQYARAQAPAAPAAPSLSEADKARFDRELAAAT